MFLHNFLILGFFPISQNHLRQFIALIVELRLAFYDAKFIIKSKFHMWNLFFSIFSMFAFPVALELAPAIGELGFLGRKSGHQGKEKVIFEFGRDALQVISCVTRIIRQNGLQRRRKLCFSSFMLTAQYPIKQGTTHPPIWIFLAFADVPFSDHSAAICHAVAAHIVLITLQAHPMCSQ